MYLDPGIDRPLEFLGDVGALVQDPVDAKPNPEQVFFGFEVDVGGPLADCVEDDRIDQLDDWRDHRQVFASFGGPSLVSLFRSLQQELFELSSLRSSVVVPVDRGENVELAGGNDFDEAGGHPTDAIDGRYVQGIGHCNSDGPVVGGHREELLLSCVGFRNGLYDFRINRLLTQVQVFDARGLGEDLCQRFFGDQAQASHH
jgi:hypothetical protein